MSISNKCLLCMVWAACLFYIVFGVPIPIDGCTSWRAESPWCVWYFFVFPDSPYVLVSFYWLHRHAFYIQI